MHFADPVRQLKPDVAWKGVGPEGRGVTVDYRRPLVGNPGMLASASCFADDARSSA
jgi:hypothetical protein